MSNVRRIPAVLFAAGLLAFLTQEGRGEVIAHGRPAQPVRVVNTDARPVPTRDVDNPAREPFQAFVPTFNESTPPTLFAVPEGKRAGVEYASITCSDPNLGQVATGVLQTHTGGVTAPHLIPLHATGGGTFSGAEATRAYADAGTFISMLARNYTTGTYSCFDGAISGYLVKVP